MEKHPLPSLPFGNFPDSAKVWIYQTGQPIGALSTDIDFLLTPFVKGWQSHGTPVRGAWTVYADRFLIVAADLEGSGVSGCSTDGLVRTIQEIGKRTGADFFNRTDAGLHGPEGWFFAPVSTVKKGGLSTPAEDLCYADLSATTLGELRKGWPVPLLQSWIPTKTTVVL